MQIATIKKLFLSGLQRLKDEIASYQQAPRLWIIDKKIANSGGNLCLHLIGNLNTYIGVELAHTHYVRQRDLEFSKKDVPQAELLRMIDETIQVVAQGLDNVSNDQLEEIFPIIIWDEEKTTSYTLLYLLNHLNYHIGQINYHRRLLDES